MEILAEADQEKLFTPYARLGNRPSGSEHSVGLGLSIVKTMTEAMGGTVACESRLGEGARFSCTLPAWS